jgi:uncharacterized protein YhbP (UPF0306 family)
VLYAPATEEAIHDQLRATLIVASIKNTPWLRAMVFFIFLNKNTSYVITHNSTVHCRIKNLNSFLIDWKLQ